VLELPFSFQDGRTYTNTDTHMQPTE